MKCTMLLGLAVAILSGPSAGAATVTETTLEMKTYPFSDPNPVPAVDETRYPYFFFDGTTDKGEMRTWKAIVLENEKISVTIFPEIGGKIWGARDKRTGRDFIYHNHVVKFRNISQRGPWCSGGIEFNFGIIGHGPWTATPVSFFTRTNGDASVSCFVSETELVTRSTWQVEINLKPDAEGFTTRTVWFNGSGLQMPYYQWMNAAFPLDRDPTFEYPGTAYIGHGGDSHPWPVENGHELRCFSGNAFGGPKSEHIVQGDNGFYGIWWPAKDGEEGLGVVHSNHVTQKYGRKVWLWPLSRAGAIWEDLLTDSDGQYTELQSGRAFNQPQGDTYKTPFKHPTFAPGVTDVFEEDWTVVRDRSVFDKAWNPANYSDRPQTAPADFNWDSAYGHYLAGEQLLRQAKWCEAEPELLKAIEKEPCFVPALGQLAMLAVRNAQYAKAHDFAAKALSMNTYDAAANYYDGLAFVAEGRLRAAKERLGLAAYSPEFRSAAFAEVARLELKEGHLDVAESMAEKSLLANALNLDAILVKIVARRLSGDREGAGRLASDILARLPLFPAARYELGRVSAGFAPVEAYVRGELPQETYLELGTWYEAAGQLEDAAAFFARAGARTAIGLVRQAHAAHLQGDDEAARRILAKAAEMPVEFALPFRRETLPALEWAARTDPSWRFSYLKAVLLAAFARDAEADALLDGCGDRPDSATFYLFRAARRTGDAALADLRAAQRAGDSWRVGHALYRHYADAGDVRTACETVEGYVRRMPSNLLNIDCANALVEDGRPKEALAFMEGTMFLPSEHGDNASGAWFDACRAIASEALARGDLAAAKAAAAKAAAYPENLGVGRPYELNFKPGTGNRRNPIADWTGELKGLLQEAFDSKSRFGNTRH